MTLVILLYSLLTVLCWFSYNLVFKLDDISYPAIQFINSVVLCCLSSPVSMMSSMASVGRPKAVSHAVVGKEKERTWFCGNDRLKTVSPCIKGKPRAVSPGMIGEQRAVPPWRPESMSPGVVGRDRAWSLGMLQNTSSYSSVTP